MAARPRVVWALKALGTATLAAGAVGALRQRHEAARVARGELPRASADRVLPTPAGEGRLARCLADWIPSQPSTPAGRWLTRAWVSPLTAVGVALAATGGGQLRWDAGHGCLVATGIRGPAAWLLARVGADANTVGHVVVSPGGEPGASLLAHEVVHVRQGERLGPLLFPAYLWASALYGYRDNPFERAARLGASRVAT